MLHNYPGMLLFKDRVIHELLKMILRQQKTFLVQLHFHFVALSYMTSQIKWKKWRWHGCRIIPLSYSYYRFKHLENSLQLLSVCYNGKINLELCQFWIRRHSQEYTFGIKWDCPAHTFHLSWKALTIKPAQQRCTWELFCTMRKQWRQLTSIAYHVLSICKEFMHSLSYHP